MAVDAAPSVKVPPASHTLTTGRFPLRACGWVVSSTTAAARRRAVDLKHLGDGFSTGTARHHTYT
jgi:hypothetical protein